MEGFTGFKTAATEELPDGVAVMDPFQVVRLAGDALDQCRRRVQQAIHGHRGRKDDPLYRARRTLHTGADLLTDKQKDRLDALFNPDVHGDAHVEVEVSWWIYQRMIAAYRHPDQTLGRRERGRQAGSDAEEARRRRAGPLRPARHVQRTHRGDQRQARTPPRLSPRVPQPHQLHRQIPARVRRVFRPAYTLDCGEPEMNYAEDRTLLFLRDFSVRTIATGVLA